MKIKLLTLFLAAVVFLASLWKGRFSLIPIKTLTKLTSQEISLLTQNQSANFVVKDLTSLFSEFPEYSQISALNIITVENSKYPWLGLNSQPIAVELPMKILFKFSGQSWESALTISGRIPKESEEWWESLARIYLSYNNEPPRLILRIRDGVSPDKGYYKEIKSVYPNEAFILDFSDNLEKTLRLQNMTGDILFKIDLVKEQSLKLSSGMFPENMLYIGVNLPKGGKLTVNKLILAN